jgi:hypothetical protein
MSDPANTPEKQPVKTDGPEGKTPEAKKPDDKAPEAKTSEAKASKGAKPVTLTVRGPANGRWRAGRKFTSEAVDIPVEELTDAELAAIKGDPELFVTVNS